MGSDRKIGVADWFYLAASAAISYWLIAEQRGSGEPRHWDIVVAHKLRVTLRRCRHWLELQDCRLQDFIDVRLDRERTV